MRWLAIDRIVGNPICEQGLMSGRRVRSRIETYGSKPREIRSANPFRKVRPRTAHRRKDRYDETSRETKRGYDRHKEKYNARRTDELPCLFANQPIRPAGRFGNPTENKLNEHQMHAPTCDTAEHNGCIHRGPHNRHLLGGVGPNKSNQMPLVGIECERSRWFRHAIANPLSRPTRHSQ